MIPPIKTEDNNITINNSIEKESNPIIDTIVTIVQEIFAVIALIVLFPISQTWFDPSKEEDIDKEQDPVLLVHGYLHNSSGWLYHRQRLHAAGIKNVFTVNLGHPLHSIEEYAEVVNEKVNEILKLTGKKSISLVGHSMGGLVSSYYANTLAPGQEVNVSQVITLGSPLNGTKVAYIGVGECARQMRPESDFVNNLQDMIHESSLRYYHMGSKTDPIVRPTESAIIEENPHHEFNDMGHVVYLLSDQVANKLISLLKV